MNRLIARLTPVRWWRTICGLVSGVRLHPDSLIFGAKSQTTFGLGSKVSARVVIDPGRTGHIVLGTNVWIAQDVEIQTDSVVRIGDGTTVQRRCTINGNTRLGTGCILAPDVFISSGTHPFRSIPHLPIREQERRLAATLSKAIDPALDRPVWVQDDVWIGTHAVICPGVMVGKGSVVGANSVVTRDVPPYCVVGGSPARCIGHRLNWQPPVKMDPANELHAPYLLDGLVCRVAGKGAFVKITAQSPMLAALTASPGFFAVAVECQVTTPTTLKIGRYAVNLAVGVTRAEVIVEHLHVANGVIRVAASVDKEYESFVEVLSLEVITASS